MSSHQPTNTEYGHPIAPPRTERPDEQPSEEKQKDTRSDGELRSDIQRARDELAQTLDALEYKLDVSARGREFVDSSKRELAKRWDDNPLLVAGVAVGAVVAIAGAVVGGIALARR